MQPGYIELFEKGILQDRRDKFAEIIGACSLCPRGCGIDRRRGEQGFCNLSDSAVVQSALPHFGEEPPISGKRGAGTVFFSSCNLRCVYCQNYQISHLMLGRTVGDEECSRMMLDLQDRGCHNIELVSATPHLFGVTGGLIEAAGKGLSLPLVYNCGGYESREAIKLLDGVVDVYLPDFKYAAEEYSSALSGVGDYGPRALEAIGEMVRQVGDGLVTENDLALRGIIIRHLVLPQMVENSFQVLQTIRKSLSTAIPLSIMSQYTPARPMENHPVLGRRVTKDEYEQVVNEAIDLGFEYLFVQEVDDDHRLPDFEKDQPFRWE